MEAFGKFWDANTLLIGIGCAIIAVAIAVGLQHGNLATIFALISGIAFMWIGKPELPVDTDEEEA